MLGAKLMQDLRSAGYPLATCESDVECFAGKKTIEVFPHPALVALLKRAYRVPYKVSKSSKYWKRTTVQERVVNLLVEFNEIERALRREFGRTHIDLPVSSAVTSLSRLKRYEDALDALSCAWVATRFIGGTAVAYGDDSAAIWVPHAYRRSNPGSSGRAEVRRSTSR